MSVGSQQVRADRELSTLEIIVAWAEARRSGRRRRACPTLSPPEVSLVARQAALLVGERPVAAVTFGELARLPAMLEASGMAAARARAACRELGSALHAAVCEGWQ